MVFGHYGHIHLSQRYVSSFECTSQINIFWQILENSSIFFEISVFHTIVCQLGLMQRVQTKNKYLIYFQSLGLIILIVFYCATIAFGAMMLQEFFTQ